MNNMKSYISFFLTGHFSKMLFKYSVREKQDVFIHRRHSYKNVVFRLKVTTHLETKTHKKDLIYSWDLETAVKHKNVLFNLANK